MILDHLQKFSTDGSQVNDDSFTIHSLVKLDRHHFKMTMTLPVVTVALLPVMLLICT